MMRRVLRISVACALLLAPALLQQARAAASVLTADQRACLQEATETLSTVGRELNQLEADHLSTVYPDQKPLFDAWVAFGAAEHAVTNQQLPAFFEEVAADQLKHLAGLPTIEFRFKLSESGKIALEKSSQEYRAAVAALATARATYEQRGGRPRLKHFRGKLELPVPPGSDAAKAYQEATKTYTAAFRKVCIIE